MIKTTLWAYQKGTTDGLPPDSIRLIKTLRGDTFLDKLQNAWQELQEGVNMVADSTDKDSKETANIAGLRQVNELIFRNCYSKLIFPFYLLGFRKERRSSSNAHDGKASQLCGTICYYP